VNISINLNDQRRLVTVKVDNEPLNDLLPPKMDSQIIRSRFVFHPLKLYGILSEYIPKSELDHAREILDELFDPLTIELVSKPELAT